MIQYSIKNQTVKLALKKNVVDTYTNGEMEFKIVLLGNKELLISNPLQSVNNAYVFHTKMVSKKDQIVIKTQITYSWYKNGTFPPPPQGLGT